MGDKLRILYVSDCLKQKAGITAVITNYLNHFDWEKIQVDLLVCDDCEQAIVDNYKDLGANIFFMPKLGLFNFFSFRRFIKVFFSKHHYQIVHSHFYIIDSIVFPLAKKAGVEKCISHSHATKLSDYKWKAIRNRIMSLNIGKLADVWAACSDEAGEALFGKKYRISPKRLLVKNGIDCVKYKYSEEKRRKVREEFGLLDNDIVIGHVGRFTPQKNHYFLIDVFSAVCEKGMRYKLVLVGDGPLMSDIKEIVHQKALDDSVIFLGTRSDVHDIFNAFDLFVFPSLYEGLGIVAIEAQANGLECVLSTNVPHEADLTSVRYLAIDNASDIWAEVITETRFKRHPEFNKIVIDAGYDISSASIELQSFYENVLNSQK